MTRKLVAYFSATGKTKAAAEAVAAAAGADLCAIEPEQPYTPEDLNWRDPESRCVAEMLDASARPRILAAGVDVEDYDVVYLGFPIWNYLPAPVVRTFCEAHDFSGKTVVAFGTCGSTGMGESADAVRKLLAESATAVDGGAFVGRPATDEEIAALAALGD